MVAQGLITTVNVPDSLLTTEQLRRKQIWENSPHTLNYWLVRVGDLPGIQQDNHLEVVIPGRSDTTEYVGSYVEVDSTGDFYWTGERVSNGMRSSWDTLTPDYGYMTMFKQDERHFGTIRVDSVTYQIRDLTDTLNILIELDTLNSDIGCATPDTSSSVGPTGNGIGSNRSVSSCRIVDVLILYTEAALAENPDIEDLVYMATEDARDRLRVSQAYNSLEFRRVGIQPLTDQEWEETTFIDADRLSIASDPEIAQYRSDFDADIVVVLTGEVYDDVSGAVTAIGEDETYVDRAFAIVEGVRAIEPTATFAHELFHLFGCRHEDRERCPNSGDTVVTFAHADIMKKGHDWGILGYNWTYYWTTLAICEKQTRKTRHISNPDVKFKGKPTGHPDKRHNVQKLREEACRVSDYVIPEEEEPTLYIIAPQYVCPEGTIILTAQIENATSPFIYSWRTSSDGFNYGSPTITPGSTLLWQAPGSIGDVIYFQLTVTTAVGVKVVETVAVIVAEEVHGVECPKIATNTRDNLIKTDRVRVYPNPAHTVLSVIFPEARRSDNNRAAMNCCVYRITGEQALGFSTSSSEIDIRLDHLSSGTYFMTCTNSHARYVSNPFILINNQ